MPGAAGGGDQMPSATGRRDGRPGAFHPPFHVGVIGPGEGATLTDIRAAEEVGAAVARVGAVVFTGGLDGVMAAAARGAARQGGFTVGLLPGTDRTGVDRAYSVAIPTGLGELRNGLLVRACDVLICVGLSWGTLSEVALAVRTGVPVVSLGDLGLPMAGPLRASTPAEAVERALAAAARSIPPANDSAHPRESGTQAGRRAHPRDPPAGRVGGPSGSL